MPQSEFMPPCQGVFVSWRGYPQVSDHPHSSSWYPGRPFYCFYQYPKILLCVVQFSSVQSLSHVQLLVTSWTAARQASLSITNSWSPPKPMSIVVGGFYLQGFNHDISLTQTLVFSLDSRLLEEVSRFCWVTPHPIWLLGAKANVRNLQSHTMNLTHFLDTT